MARTRGVSNFSANYEVKIQGALDARTLVPTKAELLLDATWKNDGLEYTYVGMVVSVYNDGTNNGIYRLTATDYTNVSNWDKLGASGDITSLSIALSSEVSTRSGADSSMSLALSTELSTRSSYDTSLSIALSTESSTRSGSYSTLSSAISSEASIRSSDISSEAGTRSSADSTLSSAISTEASTRAAADSTFLIKTNNLSDLTNTASARSNIGLGNVDNTADANKSVNYANTAGYAGSAGSAGSVDWSNISSKPGWEPHLIDNVSGLIINYPLYIQNQGIFGSLVNSSVRQFKVEGQFIRGAYIAYIDSVVIDPRYGYGTTTCSMIIVPTSISSIPGFYLPMAADGTGAGEIYGGQEIIFINQSNYSMTIIGKRPDPPHTGYPIINGGVLADTVNVSAKHQYGVIWGGSYWCNHIYR